MLQNFDQEHLPEPMPYSLPDSKIIFLTAQNDPDLVLQVLSHGATGYVLKVDAKTELLVAIAAVIQGRRFVSKTLILDV